VKRLRSKANRRVTPPEEHAGRSWAWILRIAFVVALLGGAGWGVGRLLDPGTLPIKEVTVDGDFRHLSTQKLQRVVEEHIRGGFFTVNVEAIRRALKQDPWVRDAAVRRVWPDALRVTVYEQVPVARWGKHGLINAYGQVFVPTSGVLPESLVQLDGPQGTAPQVLDHAQLLSRVLSTVHQSFTRLVLDQRRAWSFVLKNGPRVVVGRNDFESRVRRFAEVFPKVLGDRSGQAVQIDLRYTNGFAVRWKPQTHDAHG